ncbi:DNA-3-methyladenine glycosylase [Micropruina sonneratiae]|uniref:DNA-3-methyladenine glycosylase n=1 Tax=Micropruina sonneratiae TaxID=2986940 RepID=UPI002227D4AB|nr:DNA-3-methyladenine glycosylase [Micropruina sp. KQZ13P-5]MCW3158871.1 DNA-3-methyladenine glycosylase [Micropruina sp. KQZ13P-5]
MDLTRDVLEVAPDLLGMRLRVGVVTVRITEVEAYNGVDDPAAHAFRGPRPHTRDLFAGPGTLYCYRSYGIHICANVVCGASGSGSAVLLRAGEVIEGRALARARRAGASDQRLARGPGCLGQALGLTLADSGRRLGEPGLDLLPRLGEAGELLSGPRVGVSVAARRPWRFWLAGEPTVSAYRPSPRLGRVAVPTTGDNGSAT